MSSYNIAQAPTPPIQNPGGEPAAKRKKEEPTGVKTQVRPEKRPHSPVQTLHKPKPQKPAHIQMQKRETMKNPLLEQLRQEDKTLTTNISVSKLNRSALSRPTPKSNMGKASNSPPTGIPGKAIKPGSKTTDDLQSCRPQVADIKSSKSAHNSPQKP